GVYLDARHRAAGTAHRIGEPDRRVAVRGPQLEQAIGRNHAYEQREQQRGIGLEVAPPLDAIGARRVVLASAAVELVEKARQFTVHDRSISRRAAPRSLRSGGTTSANTPKTEEHDGRESEALRVPRR